MLSDRAEILNVFGVVIVAKAFCFWLRGGLFWLSVTGKKILLATRKKSARCARVARCACNGYICVMVIVQKKNILNFIVKKKYFKFHSYVRL
jgi:hypothetical protein